MDIKRVIEQKPFWKTYWYVFPVVLLISVSIAAKAYLGDTSFVIDRSALQFAQVQQGEFVIEVSGIGQLKPENTQWISSIVPGRVEQVMVKPGTQVKTGQALVRLSNPDLKRNLEKAQWELEATKAEMQASIVQLASQLVDLENSVDEAEFNYKSTKLKLDAETELLKSGKASISKIEYQRTKLSVTQQKQRWQAQIRRAQNMKDNIEASKVAQEARLALVQSNFQSIQSQVDGLIVRSHSEGTIQTISLELGQQVNTGESVATVADHASLIAELKIQELQIQNIAVGQPVIIDTRSSEINGKVTRIDPRVNQGMVQIDVSLAGELPAEARPDLNIEGRVIVEQIPDTLFVRRPAFAPRNTEVKLFLLSKDEQFVDRKTVQLGVNSINKVQIKAGLKVGDYIVTSDTAKIAQHQQILIN